MASIVPASEVPRASLEPLLIEAFGPARTEFLLQHGDWLHRGPENRLVVVEEGDPVAYCAFIPTRCLIDSAIVPARWWVDLYVAKGCRDRGYQNLLDEEVRGNGILTLGFPNELAAKIHRKHGWGVHEDLRSLLLPLRLSELGPVNRQRGLRRGVANLAARLLQPFASAQAARLSRLPTEGADRLELNLVGELAAVFANHHDPGMMTTARDRDYLEWRYLHAPYRNRLRVYVGGEKERPRLAVITRTVGLEGSLAVRVLDAFGELQDRSSLEAALRLAVRDAVGEGAIQVTALASLPQLTLAMRRCGFRISRRARFCCWSREPESIRRLSSLPQHWVLADSDNDLWSGLEEG